MVANVKIGSAHSVGRAGQRRRWGRKRPGWRGTAAAAAVRARARVWVLSVVGVVAALLLLLLLPLVVDLAAVAGL